MSKLSSTSNKAPWDHVSHLLLGWTIECYRIWYFKQLKVLRIVNTGGLCIHRLLQEWILDNFVSFAISERCTSVSFMYSSITSGDVISGSIVDRWFTEFWMEVDCVCNGGSLCFVEFSEMEYINEHFCRFLVTLISNSFHEPFLEQRKVGIVRFYGF